MHQRLLQANLDLACSEDLSFIFVFFPAGTASEKNEMQLREEWKHILIRAGEKKWTSLLLQLEVLPPLELIIDLIARHQSVIQNEATAGKEKHLVTRTHGQGIAHINLLSGSVTLVRYPVVLAEEKLKRGKVITLYPENEVKVLHLMGHAAERSLFEEIEIETVRIKKRDAGMSDPGSIPEGDEENIDQSGAFLP